MPDCGGAVPHEAAGRAGPPGRGGRVPRRKYRHRQSVFLRAPSQLSSPLLLWSYRHRRSRPVRYWTTMRRIALVVGLLALGCGRLKGTLHRSAEARVKRAIRPVLVTTHLCACITPAAAGQQPRAPALALRCRLTPTLVATR